MPPDNDEDDDLFGDGDTSIGPGSSSGGGGGGGSGTNNNNNGSSNKNGGSSLIDLLGDLDFGSVGVSSGSEPVSPLAADKGVLRLGGSGVIAVENESKTDGDIDDVVVAGAKDSAGADADNDTTISNDTAAAAATVDDDDNDNAAAPSSSAAAAATADDDDNNGGGGGGAPESDNDTTDAPAAQEDPLQQMRASLAADIAALEAQIVEATAREDFERCAELDEKMSLLQQELSML